MMMKMMAVDNSLFLFLLVWTSVLLQGTTTSAQDDGGGGPKYDDMFNQQCPNYRCSKNEVPVPKSRMKFESMGCSSMSSGGMMAFNVGGGGAGKKEPFESCCDAFHACLQICGASKSSCDQEFKQCTDTLCALPEHGGEGGECAKAANLAQLMGKLGGCNTFNQAQYKSCDCVAKDKVPERREAAIRNFYKKHAPENVEKCKELAKKADSTSKLVGLFKKLLQKYPAAIEHKEDPKQKMYEDMFKKAGGGGGSPEGTKEKEEVVDDGGDADDTEEEKIEL
jgi:hypothetical protein